jgi:hypothetical protein
MPSTTNPRDLVMTEAEPAPPPDVTVPEPAEAERGSVARTLDPQLVTDINRLAERIGGMDKLKAIVDQLAARHDARCRK